MSHLKCFLEMLNTIEPQELAGTLMTWCTSVQLHHEQKQMGRFSCTTAATLSLSVLDKVVLNFPQPACVSVLLPGL